MSSHYYQIYDFWKFLKHPEKYKGRRPITMRSSWEMKFALWMDSRSSVLEWNSEDVIIPYDFFDKDKKIVRKHRYFVDFWMKALTEDGTREFLIEIKPLADTKEPKPPKKNTRSYNERVYNFLKNQAKWEAARAFCEQQKLLGKNIEFQVLTEEDLPLKK